MDRGKYKLWILRGKFLDHYYDDTAVVWAASKEAAVDLLLKERDPGRPFSDKSIEDCIEWRHGNPVPHLLSLDWEAIDMAEPKVVVVVNGGE